MWYNHFNNYNTLKWLTFWGILTLILSYLTEEFQNTSLYWATIISAAILVGGLLFGIGRWCYNKSQLKTPFKSKYLRGDKYRFLWSNDEVKLHNLPKGTWLKTNKELILERNTKHTIYLDLIPQISHEINRIDARFNPKNENQPKVEEFQDITPPPDLYSKDSYKSSEEKGVAISYSPNMAITKGGKAIDYILLIETYNQWEGELSLRYEFIRLGIRDIKIKVKVN